VSARCRITKAEAERCACLVPISAGPEQRPCSYWHLALDQPRDTWEPSQPDAALGKLSKPLLMASISNSLITHKPRVLHLEEVKQR